MKRTAFIDDEARRAHDERVLREGGTLSNDQGIYTLAERARIREEIRRQIEAAEAVFASMPRRGPNPRIEAIRAEAGRGSLDS